MAGGKIDDAQATHAERDTLLDVESLIVRAAVPDDLAHAMEECPIALLMWFGRLEVAVFCETCDATHELVPLTEQ
jgi:hypothetical protein